MATVILEVLVATAGVKVVVVVVVIVTTKVDEVPMSISNAMIARKLFYMVSIV